MPWLIVFDNVDDGKILRSFWPIAQKGALLITARNTTSSFTPAAEIFHLRSFSNEEGSQMILRTLELKDQSLTETDTELAMQLSIILGGLPLALAQTIGYITTVQCSIPDFLETYNEQRQSGSGLFSPRSFGDFNYEHTLSTVWDMTLSKMDERSNLLLSMLAFLDPDRIPESLFQDGKPTCVATAEKLFLPTKAE